MTRLLALALAVGLAVAPAAALAQPAPAPVVPAGVPAKATITVRVVDAGTAPGPTDPRLAPYADALSRTPFQSFRLLSEQTFRVPDGGNGSLALPDGRTLQLTLTSHNSTEAHVTVHTLRAGHEPVETALTIRRNRAFLYVLRTASPDRAILIKVDVGY